MCLTPITLKKYKSRLLKSYKRVPCGKCEQCLKTLRNQWSIRLFHEQKNCLNSAFITLTYNDENLPFGYNDLPTLHKPDFQNFIKRVRNDNPYNLSYYAVGEYGSRTGRPHYHAIMFNIDKNLISKKWQTFNNKSKESKPLGYVRIDKCELGSIHYVTKYVLNKLDYAKSKQEKPFSLMSKGIGNKYIEETTTFHRENMLSVCILPGGIKHAMPRYYKDKIFTKEEKTILSKMAEQERILNTLENDREINLGKIDYLKKTVNLNKKSNIF